MTPSEYRDFAVELGAQIQRRQLSVTAAAKILGISRQSLHSHLGLGGPHQPRWSMIRRAVRVWDMVIYAQGKKFDRSAFGVEIIQGATAVQLLLPEALDRIENASLEVSVLRKNASSLALEVLVKFGT
jgi:hypothetical protein